SQSVALDRQRSHGSSQTIAPAMTATSAIATSAGRLTSSGDGTIGAVIPTSAPQETNSAPARRPPDRGLTEPSTTAVVGRIGPKLQEEQSPPRHAAEPAW